MSDEDREEMLHKVRDIVGETTLMGEAFGALHEVFVSAMAAGFNEKQALYIIAMGLFGKPDGSSD